MQVKSAFQQKIKKFFDFLFKNFEQLPDPLTKNQVNELVEHYMACVPHWLTSSRVNDFTLCFDTNVGVITKNIAYAQQNVGKETSFKVNFSLQVQLLNGFK